jgi:hypothetical protein
LDFERGTKLHGEDMKATKMAALVVASMLGTGATAAMAQPYGYGAPGYYGGSYAYEYGENRDTGYGQGGTAGTHPTGANVGPGRAEMNHATR